MTLPTLPAQHDELFDACRRVALRRTQRRGFYLDEMEADNAAGEMVACLWERWDEVPEGDTWALARWAWNKVERRVLPAFTRHDVELPEEVAQAQEDSLTYWEVRRRIERMGQEDQIIALRIINGETATTSQNSGAYKRRAARVRAALQAAIA